MVYHLNRGSQYHIRKKQKGAALRLTSPAALREDGLGPPAAPGDEPAMGLGQGAEPPAASASGDAGVGLNSPY
jgi:hypothetical protein